MKEFLKEKVRKFEFLRRMYHQIISKYEYYLISDQAFYKKRYREVFKRDLNLNKPFRLTEKIQWLKLYDRKDIYTQFADKYAVRDYLKSRFGEEYLVPLLFQTTDYKDINAENIPDVHCIVKANHDSGHYYIIRDKSDVDFTQLQKKCKQWLSNDYYRVSKEWQYKNISPRRIVVEKLLETKEGKIPNDYKLHFINGSLQFVYVSFDREGKNDRCVYDCNWNRCPFVWVPKETYREDMNTSDVPKPATFEKMIEFGSIIAKDFSYVRVDFYDVDGVLFFGEITLHHGSGFDSFFPDEYDSYFGKMCVLPQ